MNIQVCNQVYSFLHANFGKSFTLNEVAKQTGIPRLDILLVLQPNLTPKEADELIDVCSDIEVCLKPKHTEPFGNEDD